MSNRIKINIVILTILASVIGFIVGQAFYYSSIFGTQIAAAFFGGGFVLVGLIGGYKLGKADK